MASARKSATATELQGESDCPWQKPFAGSTKKATAEECEERIGYIERKKAHTYGVIIKPSISNCTCNMRVGVLLEQNPEANIQKRH